MRKFLVHTLLFVCTFAVSLTLGSGLASADPITGKTYSEAVTAINNRSGTPVVATVSGSALALDDCIVTSWNQSIFLDTDGNNTRSREYRLNLNCNNPVATPGHPGNSVMSPQGVKAKKDQTSAANINKNPAWCKETEERLNWCTKLCERTGLCEI